MKKLTLLSLLIIISSLNLPAASYSAYIIHLKNGGRFLTPRHWEENHQLRFSVTGGVMGIEKETVSKIEYFASDVAIFPEVKTPEKLPAEAGQKAEKNPSPQKSPVAIDLTAYREIMTNLKTELNKTLTRIRKATASNDLDAKKQATEENQLISSEMWKITEEVKGKNNGKLPPDWWEGIGREAPEPATP